MTDSDFNAQITRGVNYLWLDRVSGYLKPQTIWSKLWWRFMPGTVIEVKWPRGWYPMDESGCVDCETSDPNTAYRWYLEQYVGRQGWHWDWKIGLFENDSLYIKIKRSKEQYASIIGLKWN